MAKTVEYGLGSLTFPRGWFMIAESSEIADKPVPLHYFGREFVAYRGESGKVYLVDAYCPHMRIHIGRNTTSYVVKDGDQIQGESIRCPGHGWRWLQRWRHDSRPGALATRHAETLSPASSPDRPTSRPPPRRAQGGIHSPPSPASRRPARPRRSR